MNSKIIFALLFLFVFSNAEDETLVYVSKTDIEKYFSRNFYGNQKNMNKSKTSIFLIDKENNEEYKCKEDIFIFEKIYYPISKLNDTIYILTNNRGNINIYYNNKYKLPFAISIDHLGRFKEVGIIETCLLRPVSKEIKISIENVETTICYVTEEVAEDLILGKKRAIFLKKGCLNKNYKVHSKLKGLHISTENAYTEKRNYPAKIVFKRK